MGQREIIDLLQSIRQSGKEDYYTAKQITSMLGEKMDLRDVYRCVLTLCKYGVIEYDRETYIMDVMNNRAVIKKYRLVENPRKNDFPFKVVK